MAKPYFPNLEEVLLVLKSELPEGVYADDLANDSDTSKRSYSSSELRAMADMIAELYENLQDINSDLFASTVTEDGIGLWEKEMFSTAQDSMLPFATRKQNLIAKIRANGGISMPAIVDVVAALITPLGIPFEIITYCGMSSSGEGGWLLDESPLDEDTWLGYADPILGAGRDPGVTPLDCDLDYAAAGITEEVMEAIQQTAYTYEVLLYGNVPTDVLTRLDQQLTALEPARSTHRITNNAPAPIPASPSGSPAFPFGV